MKGRICVDDLANEREKKLALEEHGLDHWKQLADQIIEYLPEQFAVYVRNEDCERVWVVGRCMHNHMRYSDRSGECGKQVAFEPLRDAEGFCQGCFEIFCEEHIWDTDAHGDDGSGQYVTDLDDFYCESCIEGRHEPPEID